jgi:Flp pilus assembly pilin Flp
VSRTTAVIAPSPSTTSVLSLAARAHHGALRVQTAAALRRLRAEERGQGTVEYVALAMLIAAVMAGVVLAAGGLKGGGIAQAVVEKVKSAIGTAGATPKVK